MTVKKCPSKRFGKNRDIPGTFTYFIDILNEETLNIGVKNLRKTEDILVDTITK
jgi:hypothetical protein